MYLESPCLVVVFLAAVISGCSEDSMTTAPVRGIVLLDGKELDHGDVVTMAIAGRMGKGAIRSDGTFEISTYDEGGGDGAILGQTRVAVICDDPKPGNLNRYEKQWGIGGDSLIPEKFTSPHTSGLEFEVLAKSNDIRILLNSDGSSVVEIQ